MDRRPQPDEYFEFYETYVSKVPDGQCLALLHSQVETLNQLAQSVTKTQAETVHPPYTWTIKQVIGHMIDVERVFGDRLHRFASGETQPQPGIDQNIYVENQDYQTPTLRSLIDEFIHCRQANSLLIQRLKPAAWDNRGTASGYSITVRALIWILVGHVEHHLQILRQRLGK